MNARTTSVGSPKRPLLRFNRQSERDADQITSVESQNENQLGRQLLRTPRSDLSTGILREIAFDVLHGGSDLIHNRVVLNHW